MTKYKAYPFYNEETKSWNVHALDKDGTILPIGHEEKGFVVFDEFVSKDQAIGWIENRHKNLELIKNPKEEN